MNICMVSSDFLPNIGGITTHIVELSKALLSLNHHVHVLNPIYGTEFNKIENIDGICVHRLYIKKQMPKIKFLYYIWESSQYLNSLIKKEQIDIVHWHDLIQGAWITKMVTANKPVVFTNHSSYFLKLFETRMGRCLVRASINHAKAIIAPSRELVQKSMRFNDKVYYIPNGVNTEMFMPMVPDSEIKKRYKIDANDFIILCPRRLDPKNGVEFLVSAVPFIKRYIKNIIFA